MHRPVQLGIVGAGRIGRVHADTLQFRLPEAKVVAIADVDHAAAERAAIDFHIPRATANCHDWLNDPDIHAIVICSSTDTHARLIHEASAAGKHVFCEKPVDLTLDGIRKAIAAADAAGVVLQVGFNRRFDPSFHRIQKAVAAGEIGTPHLVRITSRDPSPPPAEYVAVSGGIFLDMTVHDFDMARYVVGQEVVEVYATGTSLVDPAIGEAGDVDTAVVVLTYESGAICTIDNSRKAVYGYDQRLEVFGSGGCLLAANQTPTTTEHWTGTAQQRDLPLHFFLERYTPAFIAEMREFLAAIDEGRTPACTGADGLEAARLAVAAKRSLSEGRPVRVQEVDAGA